MIWKYDLLMFLFYIGSVIIEVINVRYFWINFFLINDIVKK